MITEWKIKRQTPPWHCNHFQVLESKGTLAFCTIHKDINRWREKFYRDMKIIHSSLTQCFIFFLVKLKYNITENLCNPWIWTLVLFYHCEGLFWKKFTASFSVWSNVSSPQVPTSLFWTRPNKLKVKLDVFWLTARNFLNRNSMSPWALLSMIATYTYTGIE